MMEGLREWIVTILSIIIFITFVEFLLPNNNHKRYINVIIGLMIMLVILRPLMGLLSGGTTLGDNILQASNQMEVMTMQNRMDTIDLANNETVTRLYKDNLKEQMKHRLEKQLGYRVHDLEIEIEEVDKKNFGMIKGITIVLLEEKQQESPPEKNAKRIKDVEVSVNVHVSLSEKNNNNVQASSIMIDSEGKVIKDDFSSFYQVDKDKINISVLKNK
ncbi:stage III sporulation protein AF [Alkaliphilus hydrothermalis]|uniref:Stage III sporulation protein AF n=1 Tax=Alkaliphilus hydrothermalis TaxID=1482730 RepID=A0ABS2NM31_9FIRM|nr:stage III sporulation protein AF [Alkaliphilus hydrothermalis]MBM7614000.1 stage III sporulation protein AF [Alkaliphilus hydrothermalis]